MVKFVRDPAMTAGVSDPEASDIDRRAQDALKFGKIAQVNYTGTPPTYRVSIGDPNDEDNYILTDWLPAGGLRAKGDRETHFLEVGEKVVLLAEGGELATAQVMPAGTYTPNSDDEKATTDKAGVWRKVFQVPSSNNGQSGQGGGDQSGSGQDSGQSQTLGEISYDRNTGTWLIQGIDSKGSITIQGAGCSIVMKDGTMTFRAKNFDFQADGSFTVESSNTAIKGTSSVKTIGPTHIGLDDASETGPLHVLLEGDIPAKQSFSKPG